MFLGSAFVYHLIMSNTPGNTLGVLLNTTGLSEQQRRKKSASRLLHIPPTSFSFQPNFQVGLALCAVPTSPFTFHSQLIAIHLVSLASTPRNCSHQATNVFVFTKSNTHIFVLMSCDPPAAFSSVGHSLILKTCLHIHAGAHAGSPSLPVLVQGFLRWKGDLHFTGCKVTFKPKVI